MYLDLQPSEGAIESARGVLEEVFPPAVAAFLDPPGTQWDAPLWGEPFEPPAVPEAQDFDLRRAQSLGMGPAGRGEPAGGDAAGARGWGLFDSDASRENALEVERRGSNQWALAPEHTADGGALLAGDMHLALRVPNIWYRAVLQVPRAGGMQRLVGITLPGTPVLVAGSNGDVAWCFTNSQIDVSDLVVLETVGDSAYATPDGRRPFEDHLEVLHVRGARDDTLHVQETIWGPLLDRDHRGRRRAYRWLAYERDAVNLGLLEMEAAGSATEAMDLANRTGIPTQNFLVVDRQGHIGWTLIGGVPWRFGHDGRVPRSWADGRCGWNGLLPPEAIPRLLDPRSGRMWTANNRVVGATALESLGDGGYALGARARQIRDALLDLEGATPSDMLSLQLDDRALFLTPWRQVLLEALEVRNDALEPSRGALRRFVEDWDGRAEVQSVGYRAVREFRDVLSSEVFTWILRPLQRADPRVRAWQLRQREGPLWQLLQERPMHWLDPRYASWEVLLQAAADTLLQRWSSLGTDLAQRTWGERNTLRMRHPLGRAVPVLAGWLDMPRQPLPGDQNMPRVQSPTSGASQRMVVSPGREEQGFFHMPGGQSGHPRSPFYRRGHRAWLEGRPTPFLPGPATHQLLLLPRAPDAAGAQGQSM
jgi:penicillin amidase